jgi:hypothetical protein
LGLGALAGILHLDAIERRARGDLAGAWDDLKAMVQVADHLARSGGGPPLRKGIALRQQALQSSLAWAADPHQTPAALRKALAEYRAFPPAPPLAPSLEVQYNRIAATIRHDPDSFIDERIGAPWNTAPLRSLAFPWWERMRALRVLRLVFAQQVVLGELEPWQWSGHNADVRASDHTGNRALKRLIDADLEPYRASTPMARPFPTDFAGSFHENVLLSRAFEQVAALRIWQLEHEGRYPERLEALVPGLLPSLPPDPYSGRPFRYRPSDGQALLPLGLSGLTGMVTGETGRLKPTRPGQWLLYSVGPNRIDDSARRDYETNPAESDLIFPLPAASELG